jgi:hypothetical protein
MTSAKRELSTDSNPVRFYFDPPRPAKAKSGTSVKSLLVRCPTTSRLTDTGQTIEEKLWAEAKVKNQKVTCSHCGGVHSWAKKDVVLGRPLR